MKALRLASFGVRGFVGEALSPSLIIDFAAAFGSFAEGQTVLLGRDTRGSSPLLHAAALSGLLSTGCRVVDLGICPTPMLQFFTPRFHAAGAISVSAGHTRAGWNALTLIGADGAVLHPVAGETVLEILHARDFLHRDWEHIGTHEPIEAYAAPYFDALAAAVDTRTIRDAAFTVLVDPVNGAGCPFLPAFADTLGLRLIPINAQPSPYPAHDPEPRPRNAMQVASIIRAVQGHVGFVLSSDMGRLSIVTEDAETASEELTLAVIADHVLGQTPGILVTNACTTRSVDDIAAQHDCRVVKTPVGQPYVLSVLADERGVIGGEGNGSVAVPRFSPAFDGFLMMALLLEAMARRNGSAAACLESLPRYHVVKRHVHADSSRLHAAIQELDHDRDWLRDGSPSHVDGLRVDWPDGWVHVRPSRTEPLLRVISESRNRDAAESRAMTLVRRLELAL